VLAVAVERYERRLGHEIDIFRVEVAKEFAAMRVETATEFAAMRVELAATRVSLLKWSFLFLDRAGGGHERDAGVPAQDNRTALGTDSRVARRWQDLQRVPRSAGVDDVDSGLQHPAIRYRARRPVPDQYAQRR